MDPPKDDSLLVWMGTAPCADGVLAGVLARYDEPHRRYHDGRHVRLVVARCVALFDEVMVAHRSAVVWAALWHDAVYDPHSKTNERDSAELADADLASLGVSAADRSEVSRLIMLTAGHVVGADDFNGAVLVDADLAVLGASSADYAAYVDAVRAEYSFVDNDAWRIGRAKVLQALLDRPQLFSTPPMASREMNARTNLEAELRALTREA